MSNAAQKFSSAQASAYIMPGHLLCVSEETLISTLLGSCVSVVLHDPLHKICGVNHYLLPRTLKGELPTDRYGDHAIKHLLTQMKMRGADMDQLQAKIFGGAHINAGNQIGERIARENVLVAEELLKNLHIPIIRKDVAGSKGRRITVNSATFEVLVKYNVK
jgi:chemotaxis receptor (MCP) glutamine deamidase CheD